MLITFGKDLSDQFKGIAGDWRINAVNLTAHLAKTRAVVKWAKSDSLGVNRIRFELPDADIKTHDIFIGAFFNLDPFARVKTARADFDGADDWLAQKAARVA